MEGEALLLPLILAEAIEKTKITTPTKSYL
jgi:hypothetical protein